MRSVAALPGSICVGALILASISGPAFAGDSVAVSFSRDVLPILSENCLLCHGPDPKARKADLRLDVKESALRTKEPIIVPGKSAESELIRRVASDDVDEVMPPPKSGRKLTPQQKETLRRWVDQGAWWGKHWAFEPPRRPDPPRVKNTAWVRNPIDAFVLARLEEEGLNPAPQADRPALIRRLSLDLTGLPPTVTELDAFVARASDRAYEEQVDRLLGSPHYGELMALDWLDAARYADTNGYQNDFARTMWPWRDWVIAALNRNQPFDRFIIDQIAGDLVSGSTREQKVASGFNRNNRTVTEAGSIEDEWRIENAVDRVETTATVFLGLTMGCGRCHDHKYDPISQREFYQFLAFFNSVNEKGVYTEQKGNVPPMLSLPRPDEELDLKRLNSAIAAGERARDAVVKWLSELKQGTLEDGRKAQQTAGANQHPTDPELRPIDERLGKLRKAKDGLEARIPSVMVMEDLPTPRPTFVLKRGRYDMPDVGHKVEPGVPTCLSPLPQGAPRNRLGLALWLASPDNPLSARVAVNRLWQQHFGTGLVKTAENFGVQSESPSHPALLDWLATEFVRSGWNVKAMHRLIVTSATYRQASKAPASLVGRDPENRLLARGPRFRLPAEVVRDNALAIAGLLSTKIGGPSVKPYQPAGLWEELAGGAGEGPYVQDKGEGLYRRSLYVYRKRTVPHPAMATFDAPSREICQVKRARTNTPLQALELLNDVTYVEAANQLARRMLSEGGQTPQDRLIYGFRRATSRKPSPAELRALLEGLGRYRQTFRAEPSAVGLWIRPGERPLPAELDSLELATYAATASVILNLDETITRE
jgi:hypothetical protein